MKKILMLFVLLVGVATTVVYASSRSVVKSKQAKMFADAIVVADNTTAIDFSITFTPVGGGTPISYYMESGFSNHNNQWHIPEGFYNVTFTAYGTYTPITSFSANGSFIEKYSSGATAVTFSNVQFYPGGGNQVWVLHY